MEDILLSLEQAYIAKQGEVKKFDALTNVVPKGVTILYGRSGAGKTYSIIKHLSRNGIKPFLLDFDNNPKLEFDYYHVGGTWFETVRLSNIARYNKPFNDLKNFMINNKLDHRVYPNIPNDRYEDWLIYDERIFPRLEEEKQDEWRELTRIYTEQEPAKKHFKNQTVIIDTYAKAVECLDDFDEFLAFFTTQGANVIIVSHETGERGKDTGVDEVFANHVEGRLRLFRDLSKTKKDTYLIVEKNRGFQGDNIIFDWER